MRARAGDLWSRLVPGVLAVLVALWLAPGPAQAQAPGRALEGDYGFKAAYLFNLAKFIQWPAGASANTNVFVVGVMGSAETAGRIAATLRGKMVDGRALLVKQVASTNDLAGCHILFVSSEAGTSVAEVRQALGTAATLLVGDAEQFAENGGMVGFEKEGNTFYLKLNLGAATQAGLKVSAKLANVARLVKSQEPN